MGNLQISSKRIEFREMQISDISKKYLGWLNDKELMRFSRQRFKTHSFGSSREYIETFRGSDNDFLGLFAREDGRLIGTMTIYRCGYHGTADMGIMIGRGEGGKGYGRESWAFMLERLLGPDDIIRKVTGGTSILNAGMVSIMEGSGMEREGRRIDQELIDGKAADTVLYGKRRLD